MKRAFVTGASYGLGKAVATSLASSGWSLILSARNTDQLAAIQNELGVTTDVEILPFDLMDIDQVSAAMNQLEKYSDLRALVHCASAQVDPDGQATLVNTSMNDLDALIRTNILGSSIVIKGALDILGKNGGGNVFLISSDWALRGAHGPPVFSATKSYISQLAHTSRREAAKNDIQITTIYPGDIATFDLDWEEPKWSLEDTVEDIRAELGNTRIPLVDICETIQFCLERKMMRVEEVIVTPLDPDYDY